MRSLRKPLALIILIFANINAFADTEAERMALSRLIYEMDALAPIIDHAKSQSEPENEKSVFQYEKMREDFNTIRIGIVHYLNINNHTPRKLLPLEKSLSYEINGNYIQKIAGQ